MCGLCHRLHDPASLCLLPEGLETPALEPLPALPDLHSHVVVGFHPLRVTFIFLMFGFVGVLFATEGGNVSAD